MALRPLPLLANISTLLPSLLLACTPIDPATESESDTDTGSASASSTSGPSTSDSGSSGSSGSGSSSSASDTSPSTDPTDPTDTGCEGECEPACTDDSECLPGFYCDWFCIGGSHLWECEGPELTPGLIGLKSAADALSLLDVDGDGTFDLVLTFPESQEVAVMLGDGAGGFANPTVSIAATIPAPHAIVSADFDLDGDLDLALLGGAGDTFGLLLGDGLGGFVSAPSEALSETTSALWGGDLDGDGTPDLLSFGVSSSPALRLHRGDGMGGFAAGEGLPVDQPEGPLAHAADLDGDGALEIILARSTGGLRAFSWDGKGLAEGEPLLEYGDAPHDAIVTGDVDGDDQIDVFATRNLNGESVLSVWSAAGPAAAYDLDAEAHVVASADLTGDNADELITMIDGAPKLRVVSRDGQDRPCRIDYALDGATTPRLVATADIDGDGLADIVSGLADTTAITVLRTGD